MEPSPISPETDSIPVLVKQACRTGSFSYFQTVLERVVANDDATLKGTIDGIKKHLDKDKDANTIFNCLSLLQHLVTSEFATVRSTIWTNEISQLVQGLMHIEKYELIGGNVGERIREKAAEVKKAAEPTRNVQHVNSSGSQLSCPSCTAHVTKREPIDTQLVFLGECDQCGFTFCTNCNREYHGILECPSSDMPVSPTRRLGTSIRETYTRLLLETLMHEAAEADRRDGDEMEDHEVCPKCHMAQLHVIPDETFGICAGCGFISCIECNGGYHGTSTCLIGGLMNLQIHDEPELIVTPPGFECNTCGDNVDDNQLASFGCEHKACISCVKGYFDVQIRDAQVHGLKCLEDGCDVQATQALVRSVVDEDIFDRYENILLDQALADIPEIVNCPRPTCQRRLTADGLYGHCEACNYRFCTACNRAYHGLVECGKTEEEIRKEITEFLAADERKRQELERKETERRRVNDQESEAFINNNYKKCSGCRADIERTEGCHHIHCIKCDTHFCWLCMAILDRQDPYRHYQPGASRCPLFEVPTDDTS